MTNEEIAKKYHAKRAFWVRFNKIAGESVFVAILLSFPLGLWWFG